MSIAEMKKKEISKGRFILTNGIFFVKECTNGKILWTSARQDARVFTSIMEAEEAVEKNNRFLKG